MRSETLQRILDEVGDKNLWWGYVHTSGSLQAKRFFTPRDTQEAEQSPFVKKVIYPFLAETREEALEYIKKQAEDGTNKNST